MAISEPTHELFPPAFSAGAFIVAKERGAAYRAPERFTDIEMPKNSPLGAIFCLASGLIVFGLASLAMRYDLGRRAVIGWLLLTLALSLTFLGFESHDFLTMIAKGGGPATSGFTSAFFGLVPLHGLHVAAGCIWMAALIAQMLRYGIDEGVKLGVQRLALFWHFLDIVWIVIFSVVYLGGLA